MSGADSAMQIFAALIVLVVGYVFTVGFVLELKERKSSQPNK